MREFDTCEEYLLNISSLSNFERRYRPDCHCSVTFRLDQELRSPWNFYYGLDNFYQNHRRYLNSLNVNQLHGSSFKGPSSDCCPIVRINVNSTVTNIPVVPCGLIGNSFFNGEFGLDTVSADLHTLPSALVVIPALCMRWKVTVLYLFFLSQQQISNIAAFESVESVIFVLNSSLSRMGKLTLGCEASIIATPSL